jgi:hypothetical protein
MRMISIGRAFAGITLGMITLFTATTPGAQASTPTAHHPVASVCDTGYRGQPAYDRACLSTATMASSVATWYAGTDSAHPLTPDQRRALCRQAKRHGMASVVHETYGDVLYDTYANNRQAERWTTAVGRGECWALGYRAVR